MWTPKKLADMITKGIFTRDEWNHLLRLLNIMSFSMFSCSHVSHFLSDPIGKQSAMSKRGQEATSSEGSPMAKRRPMVPAKTRPVNLVLRSPWSARENPPQDLGYPVDSVNADEGQDCQTSTRKLVRTTQSPQVESYQMRREEKAQNSTPWKQDDTEVSSYSYWYRETCTDSDSKDRVSKCEVHKPSIHDEDLPFLTKEVGEVLEEKGGLCEGAHPFAVAFHRDVYLFEGFTGTEDLHEALRKDGFQSLFVAGGFFANDTSLLRAACWTMASGMRLANHVKFQCGDIRKFDWCCEILSEAGAPCGSRFRLEGALRCHHLRSNLHGHGRQTSVFASVITNQCPWCRYAFSTTVIARKHAAASMLSGHCRVDAGAFPWSMSPPESLQCSLCDDENCLHIH